MKSLHLFIVDPQRDFCDPDGALSVPGADKDMERLAKLIRRIGNDIRLIHCTLDAHHFFDISHPVFWADSKGNPPEPFTIISADDVRNSVWRTACPEHQDYALEYVSRLAANNRYPLCIWPPHCLIGTRGYTAVPVLSEVLKDWEARHKTVVNYIVKGSNYKTEHYSAVQADVPDSGDPSTLMNHNLITMIEKADVLLIAGEALSHCLKFTVEDIADAVEKKFIRNMVLLEDCTSPVPGFEQQGRDFIKNMTARGMQISRSADFSV